MNAVSEKPVPMDSPARSVAPPMAEIEAPRKRKLFRRVIRPLLLVAVIGGAVLTGAWWIGEGRYIVSTDNAYVQGDIAVLGPRIEGDVAAIPVADNQAVHAGDPLIVLDPTDWQAKVAQAAGAVDEAAAAIETARRQVDQSRAQMAQSDAMIAQAEAESTRATADEGRAGSLVGAGWTSRQANDLAIADARKATAALAAARAQRASADQALAVAQAQVTQYTAHKETADAALKLARSNLSYTIIRAPFDGIVGNRAAQLGEHVMPAQQLIAVAPPRDRLYVVANFKETQLAAMQAGQRVTLVPDIAGAAVTGRVESLAPATGALFSLLPPANATGNFTKVVQRVPVKIAIDPTDAQAAGWLRAGLSVTAEVDTRGPDAERLGLLGAAAATLHIR
jgi:membrane fusion protein (multidrug efflux system)